MARRTAAGLVLLLLLVAVASFFWRRDGESDATDSREAGTTGAPQGRELAPELATAPLQSAPHARSGKEDLKDSTTSVRSEPWRVVGTVRETTREPIVGSEVWIAISRGDLVDVLPPVRSSEDGSFTLAAPVLDGWSEMVRSAASLTARGSAPGHRPGTSGATSLPADSVSHEIRVDLVLERGASLSGRVMTGSGAPVRWAQVELCAMDKRGQGFATTDERGDFAFPIWAPGVVRVLASREGIGSAASYTVPVDPGHDVSIPDLVLRGEGWIEGKVVHPDGSPAPFLPIDARPLRDTSRDPRGGCAPPPDGLTATQVHSGPDGRFRLAGLLPGRYFVFPFDEEPAEGDFGKTEHETGERDVVVVSHKHRLLLRVHDAHGRPVPGAEYEVKGATDDDSSSFSGAGSLTGEEACEAMALEAGMKVVAFASTSTLRSANAEVRISEEAFDTELILVLRSNRDAGRVRLMVLGPDRMPLPTFLAEITKRLSGAGVVTSFEFGSADGGLSPLLDPGRYDVVVWPERSGTGPRTELFAPWRGVVDVVRGKEIAVTAAARPAGRLRLTFRAPSSAPLDPMIRIELRKPGDTDGLALFASGFRGSQPAAPGSLPTDVPLEYEDAIEPGRFTLHVEAEGVRPFEALIEIEPGKTREQEVSLEPR